MGPGAEIISAPGVLSGASHPPIQPTIFHPRRCLPAQRPFSGHRRCFAACGSGVTSLCVAQHPRIPRTDALLADPRLAAAERRLGRPLVKAAIARAQQEARAGVILADLDAVADAAVA